MEIIRKYNNKIENTIELKKLQEEIDKSQENINYAQENINNIENNTLRKMKENSIKKKLHKVLSGKKPKQIQNFVNLLQKKTHKYQRKLVINLD